MPVCSMALQIARNSQGWPMHSLKPAGLPPDSRRISPMKAIISSGAENARVGGRRDAVLVHGDAADPGYLLGHFGRRQDAAMAGLGALADLELDHLDLIVGCDAGEFFRIERAVAVAATEIAGADLPDQVAAVLAMIRAD